MRVVGEVLARHTERVGRLEVPSGVDDVARGYRLGLRLPGVSRGQLEPLARPPHTLHLAVLPHVQLEVLRHLTVVGECVPSARLLGCRDDPYATAHQLISS